MAGAPEARKHLFGIVSATRRSYPPILMSASWSAGTSLKLNGETSLHMPKALAMPRRVSLALIKLVGKESNLLGGRRGERGAATANDVVNAPVSTHIPDAQTCQKAQWLLYRPRPQFPQARFKCGCARGHRKPIRLLLNTERIGWWSSIAVTTIEPVNKEAAPICRGHLWTVVCFFLDFRNFGLGLKLRLKAQIKTVNVTLRTWLDWYSGEGLSRHPVVRACFNLRSHSKIQTPLFRL